MNLWIMKRLCDCLQCFSFLWHAFSWFFSSSFLWSSYCVLDKMHRAVVLAPATASVRQGWELEQVRRGHGNKHWRGARWLWSSFFSSSFSFFLTSNWKISQLLLLFHKRIWMWCKGRGEGQYQQGVRQKPSVGGCLWAHNTSKSWALTNLNANSLTEFSEYHQGSPGG